MSRPTAQRAAVSVEETTKLDLLVRVPIIAAFLAGPFIVSGGLDSFRLPKELFFEACAILAAGALSIQFLFEGAALRRRVVAVRWEVALAACAVLWTTVATALSTNRAISAQSLLWVASAGVLFVATVIAARSWSVGGAASILLVPAVLNAATAVLQRLDIWSPVHALDQSLSLRYRTTAFIGNADDLGCYLVPSLVIALALGSAQRGRLRVGCFSATAIIGAGILASGSFGAMISVIAAASAMALLAGGRQKLRMAALGLVVALAALAIVKPLRERLTSTAIAIRNADFMAATSNRVPAFMSAWAMFRSRPLIGLGPGTFHWWYMPYKMELNHKYPALTDADLENFGEAHNDHLELLAVAGLPGYAIFLSAMARLGRLSLRGETTGRLATDLVRVCALPLSLAIFILTLTQFPLELAAPLGAILQSAALCVAWGQR
jgi:O-antigen ligase